MQSGCSLLRLPCNNNTESRESSWLAVTNGEHLAKEAVAPINIYFKKLNPWLTAPKGATPVTH